MYLFIFEDGEVKKYDKVCQGDFDEADAGILDVIDVSADEPLQYHDCGWHEIESV